MCGQLHHLPSNSKQKTGDHARGGHLISWDLKIKSGMPLVENRDMNFCIMFFLNKCMVSFDCFPLTDHSDVFFISVGARRAAKYGKVCFESSY